MKLLKKLGLILAMCPALLFGVAEAEDLTISDSAGLVSFLERVSGGESFSGNTITLSGDIDMNGVAWIPAGTDKTPFAGTFDGKGHSIINLTGSFSADKTYVGLIGYNKGTVKNLTVESAVPSGEGWDIGIDHWTDAGHNFAAIIVGYNEGNIDSCKSQGVITIYNLISFSANGGICGYNSGSIINCINEADVHAVNNTEWNLVPTLADAYTGGIAGINEGTVIGCSSTADTEVRAESRFGSTSAGCIVADNRKGGIVSDCTGMGTAFAWTKFAMNMGYGYAGGVVGSNGGKIMGCTAQNATAKGVIQGADESYRFDYADVGGICGYNYGTIEDCQAVDSKVMAGIHAQAQPSYMAYAGGVCGYNTGKIINVKSNTKYESVSHDGRKLTPDYLGGICGYNKGGIISRAICSTARVAYTGLNERSRYLGGVVGVNDEGYVSLSGSSATLSGDTAVGVTSGGVAGKNTGMVENCYYTGTLVKGNIAAGIVGENTGVLRDSYSKAVISANAPKKDGVTYNNQGHVENCFTQADTSCEGAEKISADKLKNSLTYKDWQFDVFWQISGNYPVIREEIGELSFFGKGDGTETSPYMITTAEELSMVRYQPDKCYRLMNDIAINGNWSPIGNCKANAFSGTFDGNGHTISGISVKANAYEYSGLFGYCVGAKIHNLTLENVTIWVNAGTGKNVYAGGICGFARENTRVENCSVSGKITASGDNVCAGGIAGDIEGEIRGSRTSGELKINAGGRYVNSLAGGISARTEGKITACNSDMAITLTENDNSGYPMEASGGIVGRMKGDISDCAFDGTADVTDKKTVYHGGIAGSIEGNIENSYTDYEMGYNESINGAIVGQVMQGDASGYYNGAISYGEIGMPINDFTSGALLALLRVNGTDSKYYWVESAKDKKPEPLYVKTSWKLDENGFTRCVLTSNTKNAKIYYTTDGTAPTEESTLYEGAFIVDLMDEVRYIVVNGNKVSDAMGFVSAPQSDYAVQITKAPVNQDGEVITAENIASATTAKIELLTEAETVDAKLFLAVFDENDRMVYAKNQATTLVKGENTVTFTELNIKNGEKLQLYVWDNEAKLVPYSRAIKLQ